MEAPSRVPAGATVEGDGIAVGDGPVTVDAYIDFLCPFCRQFEERSGPALRHAIGLGDGFAGCVREGAYVDWPAYVTEHAAERGVSGTPSVYVEGVPVTASASTIAAEVSAAGSST